MLYVSESNIKIIYLFVDIYDVSINYIFYILLFLLFRLTQCFFNFTQFYNNLQKIKQFSHISIIFWWEPWSFEIPAYFLPFDKKFLNTPWYNYYYYRLESWTRWHILEDRICMFVLFFLWILA